MWGKKEPRPYWTYRCENCMRCMNFCPKNAIEAGHSWAVILYYVTMIPVSDYVLNWLGGRVPWLASVKRAGLGMLLQYGYMLLAISVAYLLFTAAIRAPAINRLFSFTTLTHYYRRYHEPETRLKDMAAKDRS